MIWKEDHEYYKRALVRSIQLNAENVIIAGVFQDKWYFLSEDERDSYYFNKASTFSNDSNMPDVNDRVAEESSLKEGSMTSLDDEEES